MLIIVCLFWSKLNYLLTYLLTARRFQGIREFPKMSTKTSISIELQDLPFITTLNLLSLLWIYKNRPCLDFPEPFLIRYVFSLEVILWDGRTTNTAREGLPESSTSEAFFSFFLIVRDANHLRNIDVFSNGKPTLELCRKINWIYPVPFVQKLKWLCF